MSKHTPGPWHVSKHGNFVRHTLSDGTTPNLCVIVEECPQRNANARLIAAAPELLEALRFALKQLEASYEVTGGSHDGGIGLEAIIVVQAAINKVEGEE